MNIEKNTSAHIIYGHWTNDETKPAAARKLEMSLSECKIEFTLMKKDCNNMQCLAI